MFLTNPMKTIWQYKDYIKFTSLNNLQMRYKNMYLGILWIFLDPILYVAVLAFVNFIVFNRFTEDFLVYLLIGMVIWKFFSASLVQGSNSIFSRIGIIEQIPVKKHIFPLIDLITNCLVFFISMILVFIFVIIFNIPITWHFIELVPTLAVCFIFCYGLSLIAAHLGALIADFKVGLTYVSWLLFFLTPIYYDYDLITDQTVKQYMLLNPAVVFIQSARESLLYGSSPSYTILSIYLIVGIFLIVLGQYLVNKYDTKYVMMK